jgi:hypothetical protein
MTALQIVAIVAGSLLFLTAVVFGLLWFETLRDEQDRADWLVEDTQELEFLPDEFDTQRRLVHDLTVPELMDLAASREEFLEQIGRDLDADTDEWVAGQFRHIARRLKRDLRFRLALRSASRSTTST